MSAREQPLHGSQIRLAMAVSGLMIAHQVAGKASRDAIFLSQFRTADLPAMVAAAAIVAIAVSVAGSRMLRRFGPHAITPISFGVSGMLQLAEWMLLGYNARIAACVIYVHVVAFGAVLLSGFWSVLNESFEPRAAKQAFGKIGGAGTLGGICGGLLAERTAAWFGAADVMLLLGGLHLACAGLLWRRFRSGPATGSDVRETRSIDAARRYPFLIVLAGLVVAASAGTALLDFVFKAQAAHTIGRGAPLLRFFGLYYTATSLLTFLLQMSFTGVFLRHAGPAAAASTLPASVSAGSVAALLIPGFPFLTVVRATEVLLRGSLFRSGYELFYTALPPADKRSVKSLIDVGADRAGDAAGAAAVSLMLVLTPGRYGPILALACAISGVAALLAARLRSGYLSALEKSLMERAIDLDPPLAADAGTRSVLMRSIAMSRPAFPDRPAKAAQGPRPPALSDSFLRRAEDLRSGDAARAIRAATELEPGDCSLAPLLLDLLAWDEVMPSARQALERIGPRITGLLVDTLLDPEREFVVRRRVPRLLASLPNRRSVEGLFTTLEDTRFEVRFHAARALFLLLKDHPHLTVDPARVWPVVNRELSVQRSVWESHRVLEERDSHEKQWFFDDELLDRADRNLEHLFTLLALLLPEDAVRIAFRALHTDDRHLKGTAFEYLESATPGDTRRLLLPVLEADAEHRSHSGASDGALRKLLASKEYVNSTLSLRPQQIEARK